MLIAFLEIKSPGFQPKDPNMDILWEELASSQTPFSRVVEHVKIELPNYLPSYMIPSAYIPIQSLPFVNSYKLDRRALKERANSLEISEIQGTISGKEYDHPKRHLKQNEGMLRNLWAGVLYMDPETIDIHDDFFSLGGDSLKAIALVSTARRKGMHFSVARLYQSRTIAELVQLTGEETFETSQIRPFSLINKADVQQIQELAIHQCGCDPQAIEDLMPVLDMQKYYLNHQRRQPGSWQVVLAMDLPSGIDSGRLQRAWEELLAYYPITRTRFVDTPLGIFQVVMNNETVKWRSEANMKELLEALKSEDVGFGHKAHQSALLKADDQTPSRLIWYVNHAIMDQIMSEHLTQELSALYESQVFSGLKRRPFKSVVYNRLKVDKVGSQVFWHSHLSGAKYRSLFEVAKDAKPLACTQLSCEAKINIPGWLRISEYSVIMTAWAIVLARFAGVEDVPFFILRVGRSSELAGSEDVMGPLLTRAPLRVCVKDRACVIDLLRKVDRDIEGLRNHEIVREEEFQKVSPEAAEHLLHGINVNFAPPSTGLTLSSDALFPVPDDVRHGLDHQSVQFLLSGELHRSSIKMNVAWDEGLIARESIQTLLSNFKGALYHLESLDQKVTTGRVVIS